MTLRTDGYSHFSVFVVGTQVFSQNVDFPVDWVGAASLLSRGVLSGMALLSSNFGLFMKAEEIPVLDSSVELTINGATTSGVFGGVSLYESGSSAYSGSGGFPLYLNAAGSNPADNNIPLWTNGVENSVLGSIDLMVANDQLGADASTFLLIHGSGITANALPFNNHMNLFLSRDTADACTLFLLAHGEPLASDIDLSMSGCGVLTSGVPLGMPNVVAELSAASKLYVHGF